MLKADSKYSRFGTPSLNNRLTRAYTFIVVQSHARSVMFDFVWIGSGRHVLIGAFVARADPLLVKHFAKITRRLPPWRLHAMPHESDYCQHGKTNQCADRPTSPCHGHKEGDGYIQAQQPAPRQLQEAQLRQMHPQK